MTENKFEIKDSGERREFEGGGKRDVDYDKPRFDLIPLTALQKIIEYYPNVTKMYLHPNNLPNDVKGKMWNLGLLWGITMDDDLLLELVWFCLKAIKDDENDYFLQFKTNSDIEFNVISPKTYFRIAKHYGDGAKKYDPWNWSKGMPLSWFHASLMRHIFAVIECKTDEDHLSAIFFNIASILHFRIIKRKDVDDITPRLISWLRSQPYKPSNIDDFDIEPERMRLEQQAKNDIKGDD